MGLGADDSEFERRGTVVSAGRVLIKTTRLREYNYGGLLQAYALQRAVRDIGGVPVTDASWPVLGPRDVVGRAYGVLRESVPALGFLKGRERWRAHSELRRFVDEDIETVNVFAWRSRPRSGFVADYDNYVVGSDQVWRPHPALNSCMLDFLSDESQAGRIAYGASFGTDELSESERFLLQGHTPSVKRFQHVSVREDSGVELCSELWGIDATHVVDPVMLYTPDEYRRFFDLGCDSSAEGADAGVAAYLLDPTSEKLRVASDLSRRLGVSVASVLPSGVSSSKTGKSRPESSAFPSVARWIESFATSRAVITDSFHGMVLAVLFEKPFVVIGNSKRGLARFESLGRTLGLESQLAPPGCRVESVDLDVDWDRVRERLALMRFTSWGFLRNALVGVRPNMSVEP